MQKFSRLFKKTSTGAIQYWDISVEGATIITRYGQLDGAEQETRDTIKTGKNVGRSNETTPAGQALLEAQAKWEKQIKKGYVQELGRAEKRETNHEGGVPPMLAHKFSEQGHKIVYPAFGQPKLDGIRCVAVMENGKCSLWTRTRKPITGVPHIVAALEKLLPAANGLVIDGELYNHKFKNDFEQIISFVRQEDPAPGHEVVEYHIYDLADSTQPFHSRVMGLNMLFARKNVAPCLIQVETIVIEDEAQVIEALGIYRAQGYEGVMVRNAAGMYVGKRSYDLLKVKEFDDAEFEILGVTEGRGKLAGHAATFVCAMPNGTKFEAKLKGSTERLREYWLNHKLWKGKKVTVRYQGLTGTNKVPRFPVGIEIRDYE